MKDAIKRGPKSVMSPFSGEGFMTGMRAAHEFFNARPVLRGEMCRVVGRQFYLRHAENYPDHAEGFRTYAYLVSQDLGCCAENAPANPHDDGGPGHPCGYGAQEQAELDETYAHLLAETGRW